MPVKAASSLIARKGSFQDALLGWYHRNARDLPWRRSPSLYRTVVSEFMLQQTRMSTVLPYFKRWMDALPGFAALAAAPEDRVLKLWEGLGYYSRSRNLHRLAQALVALPEIPHSPEAWRLLPGVGPYTAAAITSISFGEPAACVDGNVVRILTRLTADPAEYRDSATAAKALTPLAADLVPATSPGDHNQAMMELGATVCLRKKPLCLLCPVRTFCAAQRSNPESYPKIASKTIERSSLVRAWCVRGESLLLHRADTSARRLAGLHELPTAEQLGLASSAVLKRPLLAKRKRSITRFQIAESVHAVGFEGSSRPGGRTGTGGLVWVPLRKIDSIALSGPHRRWVNEILALQAAGRISFPSRRAADKRPGPSAEKVCPQRAFVRRDGTE
jgi:A/G-specific adenine glycosylase